MINNIIQSISTIYATVYLSALAVGTAQSSEAFFPLWSTLIFIIIVATLPFLGILAGRKMQGDIGQTRLEINEMKDEMKTLREANQTLREQNIENQFHLQQSMDHIGELSTINQQLRERIDVLEDSAR